MGDGQKSKHSRVITHVRLSSERVHVFMNVGGNASYQEGRDNGG